MDADVPFTLADHAASLLANLEAEANDKPAEEVPKKDLIPDKAGDTPAVEDNKADDKKEEVAAEDKPQAEDDGAFDFEGDGKVAESPDAKDDTEDIIRQTGMDDRQAEAFRSIRQELKSFKKGERLPVEIQAKVKAAENAEARARELEKRVEELTAEDYRLKVRESPEYRAEIAAPLDRVDSLLRQIASEYGDEGVTYEALQNIVENTSLRKQGEAIEELNVDSAVKTRLIAAAATVQDTYAASEQMMKAGREKWEAIQREREIEAAREQEKVRDFRARTAANLQDKFLNYPALKGNDEFASKVKEAASEAAATDFDSMSAHNKVLAYMSGKVLSSLLKEYSSIRQKMGEAADLKKAERDANPNLSEGGAMPPEEKKEPETLEELMRLHGAEFGM